MKEQKKCVPEIRFAGFTDDWEQRKLGEVVDIFDGTHQTPKYTDKGVMFLSVEDIKTLSSNKFISEVDFKKEFKNFPRKGDVLMTRIGDVGTANVVLSDHEVAYYVSLALLKPKGIHSFFLATAISSSSVQSDIWKRTLHIAFPKKINKSEIEKIDIFLPSSEEQQKIGNFFKQLDDTIALHQRTLEKYQKLKISYLEKMFPKENEQFPELRFPNFTDAWEQRKLGDVFTQVIFQVNPQKTSYELYSLTVENGLVGKSERYNRNFLVLKEDRFKLVQHNEFAYNPMNLTLGSIDLNQLNKTIAVSGYYVTMKVKDKFDPLFLRVWLKSGIALKSYKASATGTLLEKQRVQFPTFSNISIFIPNLEEQTAIGNFFKQLDDTIALHQREVEKYKKIKQAYLEKMFI